MSLRLRPYPRAPQGLLACGELRTLPISAVARAAIAASLALSCGTEGPTQQWSESVIYGADDRREYFEVTDPALRNLTSQAVVALIPNELLRAGALDDRVVPTYGDAEGLCPGQPFTDQPAAAFCSGVLVDYDLVLTAGHCVRALALTEFSVVFDYYYDQPNHLALDAASVYAAREIPSFRRDPPGTEPRLDFGWLRLAKPVGANRSPIPVSTQQPTLAPQQPLLAISAGGGLPIKLDSGPRLQDARATSRDYFVASSDTSRGSSGGAVLDATLTLLGILSRGGTDFELQGDCVTETQSEETTAEEQYTYAFRAVEQLCAESSSSLCRSDCGPVCEALRPVAESDTGCSVVHTAAAHTNSGPRIGLMFGLVSCAMTLRRLRRADNQRRSARPHSTG